MAAHEGGASPSARRPWYRRVRSGTWDVEDWTLALRSLVVHLKRDRITVAAGAFAFRWFLSLFPIVIALLGIASLVRIPHHVVVSLVNGIDAALPAGASAVLQEAVTNASTSNATLTATVVAGAIGLWSGLSGMVMVEEALDMAYELAADRSFLRKRLVGLPLLGASAVLGGAASGLVVFGRQIGSLIEHHLPVGGSVFAAGWTAARWVLALAFVMLLLSLIYHVAPNRKQLRWFVASPGSLVATALWAVISLGFSYYTTSFGSYAKTYGAFAGVAILIFWLFLTGIAIFLGAELDAAFERQRAARNARLSGQAVAPAVPPPPASSPPPPPPA